MLLGSTIYDVPEGEDPFEAMHRLGWTDGLPVVPPTRDRVCDFIVASGGLASDVVSTMPPQNISVTIEKIAINAVMAGCRAEFMPLVIASIKAVCQDAFNLHGVLCTMMSVSPVLILQGDVVKELGMNGGVNVFGQGNRPAQSIGRAVQLTIRNLTGSKPGEVDRACFGNPGKTSFCFPDMSQHFGWEPLSDSLGASGGSSNVVAFAGEGPRTVADTLSRTAESLAQSLASGLRSAIPPRHALVFDAMLVVSPEHQRIFANCNWSKARLAEELNELLTVSGGELLQDSDGWQEGLPLAAEGAESLRWHKLLEIYPAVRPEWRVPLFRPGGILIAVAGGETGPVSTVIAGWVNGAVGSMPVVEEVNV